MSAARLIAGRLHAAAAAASPLRSTGLVRGALSTLLMQKQKEGSAVCASVSGPSNTSYPNQRSSVAAADGARSASSGSVLSSRRSGLGGS